MSERTDRWEKQKLQKCPPNEIMAALVDQELLLYSNLSNEESAWKSVQRGCRQLTEHRCRR